MTAGFDIGQRLIEYVTPRTYGRAFWVGLLNTLLVASIGIVLATFLGFIIGIARLSKKLARAEDRDDLCRTDPQHAAAAAIALLVQCGVLKALPEVRNSAALPGGAFLNNRGLFMPDPTFGPSFRFVLIALLWAVSVTGPMAAGPGSARRDRRAGSPAAVALGLIVALPLAVYFLAGQPLTLTYPNLGASTSRADFRSSRNSWRWLWDWSSTPPPSSRKWCAPAFRP